MFSHSDARHLGTRQNGPGRRCGGSLIGQRLPLVILTLALGITALNPAQAQSGAQLQSLTLKPTTVVGGDKPTGAVTLNAPAPTGGAVVRLQSSDTVVATVPTSVTVTAGQTSATFTINTRPVTGWTYPLLSATYNAQTRTATLSVSKAGANPQIPQGSSASFRKRGSETPTAGLTWDITRSGSTVATNNKPNGWTVSYDTTSPAFTVGAPLLAPLATNYKVRSTSGSESDSARFDVVPINAGIVGNPLPAWAEDVRPTDTVSAGGAGPSAADSVDLATGVEENRPGPDIVVRNPLGPDAVYARMYRSARAAEGYASPGLTPGWVDNYDVTMTGAAGAWGPLQLVYPNGAIEALSPVLYAGRPTGRLTPPSGAPYLVLGTPSTTLGRWLALRLFFRDESSWTFLPDPQNADRYLLRQVSDLVGNSLFITYDSANRLRAITDDASPPNTLLGFTYDANGRLSGLRDISGRQVRFTYSVQAGTTCLTTASQITPVGTTARMRWKYGYTALNGQPYLNFVAVPGPNTGTGVVSHPILYYPDGRVCTLPDANGNRRRFTYQSGSTLVEVFDAAGNRCMTWTQKFNGLRTDAGIIDAAGHSSSLLYEDPANTYRVTRVINRNGQAVQMTYDPFGNLLTVLTPRELKMTYTYDYSIFPEGRLIQVQEGTKTSTKFHYFPNGLLESVETPVPGQSGVDQWVRTTYTYHVRGGGIQGFSGGGGGRTLGNVETVTMPAPNNTPGATVTYRYNYTNDPLDGYSKPEALDEPVTLTDPLGHVTHFRYQDGLHNLTAVIDPLGNRTDFRYNTHHQPLDVSFPATGQLGAGRTQHLYSYAYPGGPLQSLSVIGEDGLAARVYLATRGKEDEQKAQSGSAQQAAFGYDCLYRPTGVQDGNGNTVRYHYDKVGNIDAVIYPLGDGVRISAFDPDGNAMERTDGRGIVTEYKRAPDDSRLTDIQYPADPANNVHRDYDLYNRIIKITDPTGTTEYAYDDLDNITSVKTTYKDLPANQQVHTITYSYFPDGSRSGMTLSTYVGNPPVAQNYTFSYTYDDAGRMTGATFPWSNGYVSYTYDAADQLKTQTSYTTYTTYFYTQRGDLFSLTNSKNTAPPRPLWSQFLSLRYDAVGNRTQIGSVYIPAVGNAPEVSHEGIGIAYTFDSKDRLIEENSNRSAVDPNPNRYNGVYVNDYTPDLADNLLSIRGVNHTYNNDNQITTGGTGQYQYDGNGNPITYKTKAILYDEENRLITLGSLITAANYRGDGRRGWKDGTNGRVYFVYDGDILLGELNSIGAIERLYGYGDNGLVERYAIPEQVIYTYTFDPDGNLVQRVPHKTDPNQHVPISTTLFDYFGVLLRDLSSTGQDYSVTDPMGYGAQWGLYTDLETRSSPTATGFSTVSDGNAYDPGNVRTLARSGGGVNEYSAASSEGGLLSPRALGDMLAGGLGERYGGPVGGAITLGLFETLYSYAEGRSLEEALSHGIEAGTLYYYGGKFISAGGRLLARTRAAQAISATVSKATGRLGIRGAGRAGTVGRNPRVYTVAYEMKLSPESYPALEEGVHFQEANQALLRAMEEDPEFAAAMEELIPGVRNLRSKTGDVVSKPPKDWTWHHHKDRVGVMQLVPRSEHSVGSPWWYILHDPPHGTGGFAKWGRRLPWE